MFVILEWTRSIGKLTIFIIFIVSPQQLVDSGIVDCGDRDIQNNKFYYIGIWIDTFIDKLNRAKCVHNLYHSAIYTNADLTWRWTFLGLKSHHATRHAARLGNIFNTPGADVNEIASEWEKLNFFVSFLIEELKYSMDDIIVIRQDGN